MIAQSLPANDFYEFYVEPLLVNMRFNEGLIPPRKLSRQLTGLLGYYADRCASPKAVHFLRMSNNAVAFNLNERFFDPACNADVLALASTLNEMLSRSSIMFALINLHRAKLDPAVFWEYAHRKKPITQLRYLKRALEREGWEVSWDVLREAMPHLTDEAFADVKLEYAFAKLSA